VGDVPRSGGERPAQGSKDDTDDGRTAIATGTDLSEPLACAAGAEEDKSCTIISSRDVRQPPFSPVIALYAAQRDPRADVGDPLAEPALRDPRTLLALVKSQQAVIASQARIIEDLRNRQVSS
jgi:hypothetical protein